ncbi:MAG: ATP-binding protein [bacterium]
MKRRRKIKVMVRSRLAILPELILFIVFGVWLFILFSQTKSIFTFVGSIFLTGGLFAYFWYLLFKTRQEEAEAQDDERINYISLMGGGLVHEIKNPLNSLNINLQLLREALKRTGREEGEAHNLISEIQEELIRLDEILTEFLRLARPPELSLKEENLNYVLEEVIRFVEPECLWAKIQINKAFQNPLPPVLLDKRQFKGAILNLILNAKTAMDKGGTLSMSTGSKRREVSLTISDTGSGIPKEKQARIFDLFYSTKEAGTGLGLPIVQRIIHDHNGKIEYQSEGGKGTTFTIILPVADKT